MFNNADAENSDETYVECECRILCGSTAVALQNGQRCDSAICFEVVAELDCCLHFNITVADHAHPGRNQVSRTGVRDRESGYFSFHNDGSCGGGGVFPGFTRRPVTAIIIGYFVESFIADTVFSECVHQHFLLGPRQQR